MDLAKKVLFHPTSYLKKILNKPKEQIKLLKKRTLNRLFISKPIKRPMKIKGKVNKYSTRDRKTLIKISTEYAVVEYSCNYELITT